MKEECVVETTSHLSTVQPRWEFLPLLSVLDGTPALLPTPGQMTHSAGSVQPGWLHPYDKLQKTWWKNVKYVNCENCLVWNNMDAFTFSLYVTYFSKYAKKHVFIWDCHFSPDSLRMSGLATVTAAVKSLPLYSVSNCHVTNWDCWVWNTVQTLSF